jgi:ribosomal protein S18 acetylase RimI-like enzyme
MRIRSLSPNDREPLVALISESWNGVTTFRPEEVSCAIELLDAALAQAEGNTYEVLVAAEDDGDGPASLGHPLGYVCFGHTPMTEATFDLYWLVVSARVRGRGIGRALVAALEEHLRTRGALTLRVETSSLEGQGGAVRFYESTGFARAGIVPDFYRRGDDLVTFTKTLS